MTSPPTGPKERRGSAPQRLPSHLGFRLDDPTRARVEAVRKGLSNPWRDATVSETYRMLLVVGLAAAAELERKGRALNDATLVGPPQEGLGKDKDRVALRVDESTEIRIEETRVKLSHAWREATRSDAIRLLVLLGLEQVDTIRGNNLNEELPELFASLAVT